MDATRPGHQEAALKIDFPTGQQAAAVTGGPRRSVPSLLEDMGLAPAPVVVLIGGADAMDPDIAPRLRRLFERGLVRAAAKAGAVLVDGGTASGVMALMGEAAAASDAAMKLVGIAPAGKVTYPGDARPIRGDTQLDPNHTHFILSNSSEWGGETTLLLDVVDALTDGRPALAVVAAGGPTTIDEVTAVARRRIPIVALAGTGGIADELAAMANSLDRATGTDGTDPLARALASSQLIVVPANADADALDMVLARLLGDDETLRSAWRQHARVAGTARRQQGRFLRQQGLVLGLGVILTLLVVAYSVLESAALGPELQGLRYVIVLLPIIIAVLVAAASRFRPGSQWVLLRGTAEAIKGEIFRYRAGAGRYSPAQTRNTAREVRLAQAVGSVMGALMRTEVNKSALAPLPSAGSVVSSSLAPDDDGISPLSPDGYIQFRIDNQLDFYRTRARTLERNVRALRWVILLFGGFGTFIAAIGFEIWVAVTTAVVGALTTYLEARQLETTIMLYNQAATDLEGIRTWFQALPPAEQTRPSRIDDLVDRAERIMQAEHAGWVQQMQDAMTQLRLEGAEEDVRRDDDRGGTTTDVGPAEKTSDVAADADISPDATGTSR